MHDNHFLLRLIIPTGGNIAYIPCMTRTIKSLFYSIFHSSVALSFGFWLVMSVSTHAFETQAQQAVLLDMTTGTTLFSKQADTAMGPSSMSKMMTVYLLLEAVEQGRVSLEDSFTVSEKAWRKGGSKMFIEVGKEVKVEDLLRGIVIQSGNDACIAVAEGLAGSEEAFARRMNQKAQELGLTGSHFANATGWPDEQHYMTADDLAKLAAALIRDFPQHYHYWAESEFTYSGIRQPNRNSLLGTLGVDGLKTGHTEAAGYGITVSGEQEGRRLVAVVNGLDSMKGRISAARRLMAYGFSNFETVKLIPAGQPIVKAKSWLATEMNVPLVVQEPIILTLPKGAVKQLKLKATFQEPLAAPLEAGVKMGELELTGPGIEEPKRYPIFTAKPLEKLAPQYRILPMMKYRLLGVY